MTEKSPFADFSVNFWRTPKGGKDTVPMVCNPKQGIFQRSAPNARSGRFHPAQYLGPREPSAFRLLFNVPREAAEVTMLPLP